MTGLASLSARFRARLDRADFSILVLCNIRAKSNSAGRIR